MSQAGVNNIMANSVNTTTDSQIYENVSATDICSDTSFSQNHIAGNNETVETIENGNHGMNPTEQSTWLPDSPIVNGSATHMNAGEIETNSQSNPEGTRFAMYHTDQYARPEDTFNVVKVVDGSKWYHQYDKNVVVKEPHMGLDGKIIYNESITKKLPPAPKRKDRM